MSNVIRREERIYDIGLNQESLSLIGLFFLKNMHEIHCLLSLFMNFKEVSLKEVFTRLIHVDLYASAEYQLPSWQVETYL